MDDREERECEARATIYLSGELHDSSLTVRVWSQIATIFVGQEENNERKQEGGAGKVKNAGLFWSIFYTNSEILFFVLTP